MTRRFLVSSALLAGALAAQTAATNASISGVVKDSVNGKPLENYEVSTMVDAAGQRGRRITVTTDASGRFKLTDLPPNSYHVAVRDPIRRGWDAIEKTVTLNGSDVDNIDFRFEVSGLIIGKVVDENHDPIPNIEVMLVSREYYLGNANYYFTTHFTHTDDKGQYAMPSVKPGWPYYLLVEKYDPRLPARSEAPLDPKMRKPVPVRTWYPNSPVRESAQAIVLSPGERRVDVDVEMRKSPSYCVEGTTIGPSGGVMRFGIEPTQPSSGATASGGTFRVPPGGLTGDDGKFRICDLYPGSYRLSAQDPKWAAEKGLIYGVAEITISDRDLQGVTVAALPGRPLTGEVVWDGDPPANAPALKSSIQLFPLSRTYFQGEDLGARTDVPGTFTIESVLPDDYGLRPLTLNAPGVYLKDITFAGRSVLYDAVRTAQSMGGAGLRLIVAHDGATLSVQVNDKDGNPGASLKVLVFPAEVRSEGELAARLVQGQTNQLGAYTSPTLPPGKYFVAAAGETVDATPESIARLWRTRNRFQDVDLPPAGSASVKLQPVTIR